MLGVSLRESTGDNYLMQTRPTLPATIRQLPARGAWPRSARGRGATKAPAGSGKAGAQRRGENCSCLNAPAHLDAEVSRATTVHYRCATTPARSA
eukprot:384031-Pyramimonas_sp.AAC.1